MDAIFAALEALSKAGTQQQSPAAPQAQPPVPASAPAPVRAKAQAQPAPKPARTPGGPAATGLLQGMFEDGNSLLRAVIAAEVLNPPAALREPGLWNQQPNEPSI